MIRLVFDKYMYREADGDAPFRCYADVNDTGRRLDGECGEGNRVVRDGEPDEAWFGAKSEEFHEMLPEEQASNINSHCWEQAIVGPDWELYEVRSNGTDLYWLQFVHDSDVKKRTERLVSLDFCASSAPFPIEIYCKPYHVSEYRKLMWRRS